MMSSITVTIELRKMLCDAETGEIMEWKSENEEGLKQFLETYPQVTMIESDIPTVRLSNCCSREGNV